MRLDSVFALRDEILESYYQSELGLVEENAIRATAAEIPRYTNQRLAIGARYCSPGDYAVAIRLESRGGRAMTRARRLQARLPDEKEVDIAVVKARVPSRIQLTAASKLPSNVPGAARRRPLEVGSSIGHGDGPPGTLGMFAGRGDTIAALANNHVIALANGGRIDDEIYQPGIPDHPCDAGNVIGRLADYRKLRRTGSNPFDAACCILSDDQEIASGGNELPAHYGAADAGRQLGEPVGVDALDTLIQEIGETATVAKNGRKTAYTRAMMQNVVFGINDVIVDVPPLGNCRFDNLIEIESVDSKQPFSDLGDSGSVCYLESACAPFGLIFAAGLTERENAGAGSKTYVTYACNLRDIFDVYHLTTL